MWIEELTLSIERALGSAHEAVERGSGSSTVPYTRGLLSWLLKGGVHSVHPLPDVLKPSCGITGDISSASILVLTNLAYTAAFDSETLSGVGGVFACLPVVRRSPAHP